jgi:hypothetical protein
MAYPVLLMAACLFTISASAIGLGNVGSTPGDHRSSREKFRARYRAHPKLVTTQVTFLVVAVILLTVAAVYFPR